MIGETALSYLKRDIVVLSAIKNSIDVPSIVKLNLNFEQELRKQKLIAENDRFYDTIFKEVAARFEQNKDINISFEKAITKYYHLRLAAIFSRLRQERRIFQKLKLLSIQRQNQQIIQAAIKQKQTTTPKIEQKQIIQEKITNQDQHILLDDDLQELRLHDKFQKLKASHDLILLSRFFYKVIKINKNLKQKQLKVAEKRSKYSKRNYLKLLQIKMKIKLIQRHKKQEQVALKIPMCEAIRNTNLLNKVFKEMKIFRNQVLEAQARLNAFLIRKEQSHEQYALKLMLNKFRKQLQKQNSVPKHRALQKLILQQLHVKFALLNQKCSMSQQIQSNTMKLLASVHITQLINKHARAKTLESRVQSRNLRAVFKLWRDNAILKLNDDPIKSIDEYLYLDQSITSMNLRYRELSVKCSVYLNIISYRIQFRSFKNWADLTSEQKKVNMFLRLKGAQKTNSVFQMLKEAFYLRKINAKLNTNYILKQNALKFIHHFGYLKGDVFEKIQQQFNEAGFENVLTDDELLRQCFEKLKENAEHKNILRIKGDYFYEEGMDIRIQKIFKIWRKMANMEAKASIFQQDFTQKQLQRVIKIWRKQAQRTLKAFKMGYTMEDRLKERSFTEWQNKTKQHIKANLIIQQLKQMKQFKTAKFIEDNIKHKQLDEILKEIDNCYANDLFDIDFENPGLVQKYMTLVHKEAKYNKEKQEQLQYISIKMLQGKTRELSFKSNRICENNQRICLWASYRQILMAITRVKNMQISEQTIKEASEYNYQHQLKRKLFSTLYRQYKLKQFQMQLEQIVVAEHQRFCLQILLIWKQKAISVNSAHTIVQEQKLSNLLQISFNIMRQKIKDLHSIEQNCQQLHQMRQIPLLFNKVKCIQNKLSVKQQNVTLLHQKTQKQLVLHHLSSKGITLQQKYIQLSPKQSDSSKLLLIKKILFKSQSLKKNYYIIEQLHTHLTKLRSIIELQTQLKMRQQNYIIAQKMHKEFLYKNAFFGFKLFLIKCRKCSLFQQSKIKLAIKQWANIARENSLYVHKERLLEKKYRKRLVITVLQVMAARADVQLKDLGWI
ncbi:Sfi1_spindle body [Hexamita inflata]|uniref:Sfi1 spindle body n=1 Tax=Hexamita inflata TaxID=28002 RepID=A0AA86QGX5_9EUKA|nr:Sfi1 spindle body [Hexamita inflata]